MAENLVINEVTYPEVEAISVTNEAGEQVGFYPDAVRYNQQTLTDEQKAQARENIGAVSVEDSPKRGVDYWTPDDIAEIKSYVDEAILGGAW